jgi:hypothetical protein
MLKRYWIILSPNNRFGANNIGVTAVTLQQAKTLVKENLRNLGWTQVLEESIDNAEAIENIDIRTLDENHVVPNIGVVSRQGIWYPNLNS